MSTRRDFVKAIPALAALPMVPEVKRLQVSADDVIVIEYPGYMPVDRRNMIEAQLKAYLGVKRVLVLCEGATMKVARMGS